MLSKITALLMLASLSTVFQVLVMVYGWGLQPKSWFWIIGVGMVWPPLLRVWIERVMKSE